MDEILREALAHEEEGLAEYHKLLDAVSGRNIMLEEYARTQIAAEDRALGRHRQDAAQARLDHLKDARASAEGGGGAIPCGRHGARARDFRPCILISRQRLRTLRANGRSKGFASWN